jgi:hypothetical protein
MRKHLFFPFFLFTALILLSACKKKDFANGKDALDPNEILTGITTDTFDIITYTIAEDSIITSNPANAVLGSYNDPKFGKFEATIFTQVGLAGLSPSIGNPNSITIDSFVLALSYVGFYGDLNPQTFEVFELNENLYLDSTYYSFSTKSTKPQNLVPNGLGSITPAPNTSAIVGLDTVSPQLRIPLDTNFARILINEAGSGSPAFASDAAFQSFFKGIKIQSNNPNQSSSTGAALYLDLDNPASKMTIYFQQNGLNRTLDFVFNNSCANFININIENTGKPIQDVLLDNTKGNVEFYAQAFKHRAVIQMPGLKNLSDKIIIHRADLTLPLQYQTGYKYRPGNSVSVATKINLTDKSYTSLGILGEFDDVKKQFKLNLKNYIQAIVNKNINNNGIVVSPRFFINSAERIVFNGKNTLNKNRPKLILTYTSY